MNILHHIPRRIKASILSLLFLSLSLAGFAQSYDYDYSENAVYVYSFIKYTEWPSDKQNITIGVVGYTPFVPEFKRLLLKKKNSTLNITLKYIKLSEANTVDVVVVALSASDKLKDVHAATNNLPILIISEKGQTSKEGACISLFIDENDEYKTRYQLSVRNCKARGLAVSEQILNNAVLVR